MDCHIGDSVPSRSGTFSSTEGAKIDKIHRTPTDQKLYDTVRNRLRSLIHGKT